MSAKRKRKDSEYGPSAEAEAELVPEAETPVGASPSEGQISAGAESPASVPRAPTAEGAPGDEAQGMPERPQGGAAEAAAAATADGSALGLEAQLKDIQEQLLRKHADFDNFRKRLTRDKDESVRYANSALLADLVEVVDGLERAIASSEVSRDFDALHQGVVLIEKQLMDGLSRKWGLDRMSCVGKPFDPAVHQAIAVGEPSGGEEQTVLEEYQSGYMLHDRVVRPAKVKVSAPRRGPEQGAAVPGSEESGLAAGLSPSAGSGTNTSGDGGPARDE